MPKLIGLQYLIFGVIWIQCIKDGGKINEHSSEANMWQRLMGKSGTRKSSQHRDFPATIDCFGYYFNEDGQLRSIESNEPFEFEVKRGDQDYNQKHYEALGKAIEEYLYQLLVNQEDLEKVIIPVDAVEGEAKSFIFMSKNISSYDKLLILIHGSGVVRAGQWTRSLIINHSLESGSQIPYIQEAKKRGYGIVVLNTNQNTDIETDKGSVRGSKIPEDHFLYVWDKIIHPTEVSNIAIMAHSYGGIVALHCALERLGEVKNRVFAVAMSDSIHGCMRIGTTPQARYFKEWFKEHSMNWVSSRLPLDTHVDSPSPIDSKRVSAGTTKHIETSWKAFPSVFKFFENKLNQRLWARSRPQSAPSTPSSPEGMKMAADFSQSPASIPPVFEAPNTPERAANQSPDKTLLSLQESKDVAFDVFMASPGVPEVPEGINDSNVQRDLPQVPEPMSPDPSSPAPAGNPESGNENPTEGRRLNNKEPVEHEEKSSEAKNTKTKF